MPESTLLPWKHALGSSRADFPLPEPAAAALFHGHGLSRESALADKEVLCRKEPYVGGNQGTGVQHHDVAGDDLRKGDFSLLAFPHDVCRGPHHGLQLLHRFPRSFLLDRGKPDTDQDHSADDEGGTEVSHEKRDAGNDEKLDDQGVGEAVYVRLKAPPFFNNDLVAAEIPEPFFGLVGSQTFLTASQPSEAFLGAERARLDERPLLLRACHGSGWISHELISTLPNGVSQAISAFFARVFSAILSSA